MKFEYLDDIEIEAEMREALGKELDWVSPKQIEYGVNAIIAMLDWEYSISLADLADFIKAWNNRSDNSPMWDSERGMLVDEHLK